MDALARDFSARKANSILPPEAPEHEDARRIAIAAGALLLRLREDLEGGRIDPERARADGDRLSNELILQELAATFPGDAVLSEESKDGEARLSSNRVWIVDPLDGTREFGEVGRTDWAVHVALIQAGAPVAAAVALPALGVTYATNDSPPPARAFRGTLRVVVSRSRPPRLAELVAARCDAELVSMGSAGAKTMAVLTGQADAYLHGGGQYEWDSAAPVGVALAAGLHASRLDGSPLVYNRPRPWLPDQLVCRAELAERILAYCREDSA